MCWRADEGVRPYDRAYGFRHSHKGQHIGPPQRTGEIPRLPRRGRCPHRPIAEAPVNCQASGSEKRSRDNAMTTPTTSAPSATGRQLQKSQKSIACPKAGQNRRLHRSADPRRAEARTRRSASKRSFLLDRAQPVFFSTRGKRKWGVHPAGPAPCGSRIPRGRRTAAHPMLPPHVAPPQQIICGHVEVIRQGHQFLIVRAAVAALIALVGTQLDTQNFPHVLLCDMTFFPQFTQSLRKFYHKISPEPLDTRVLHVYYEYVQFACLGGVF